MRFSTISIIVITFIIYTGKIENGKVLASPIAPIATDPIAIDPDFDPMKAIKEGVELNEELMKTLKSIVQSSAIMKKIDQEIHKIKLVNDYLEQKEIQMVTDAKVQLALAENEFTILRIELTEMAEYTKATTTKLIKFTKRLSKDSSQKFNKQFKVIFKRFITLMNVTSKKLAEAKERYDAMAKNLATTQGKLDAFKDRVERLGDEHSKRYKEYAHKLRSEAYGGSAACIAFAPSCPGIYAAVAVIVEDQLSQYWIEVEALKLKAVYVSESVTGLVGQITAKDKELKKELKLVIKWETSVLAAKDNFGATPITETIQDILDLKDIAIEDFQNLYNAADAFNKAILTA